MKTIILALNCYLLTLFACLAAPSGITVETLGAVRLVGVDGGEQWGAGVQGSYDLNKHVALTGRAIAYETENWGGSTVDEASAGVEARLLRSANGKFGLSALGLVHRSFGQYEAWGIGLGGKATATIYKSLHAFGQAEYRIWDKRPENDDLLLSFGLGLRF